MKEKAGSVIKILIVAYVVTAVLLLLVSGIMYRFTLPLEQIQIGVMGIYVLANLVAGFLMGKVSKEKKFIWGLVMGIAYFVVLSIVSFVIHQSFYTDGEQTLIVFLTCAGSGMFGGMIS